MTTGKGMRKLLRLLYDEYRDLLEALSALYSRRDRANRASAKKTLRHRTSAVGSRGKRRFYLHDYIIFQDERELVLLLPEYELSELRVALGNREAHRISSMRTGRKLPNYRGGTRKRKRSLPLERLLM